MKAKLAVLLTALSCNVNEPIRIALVGPTSTPGTSAALWSAEHAANAINTAGGIDGRPLQLVIEDDSAQPEPAARLARRLSDDPTIVAVIGYMNSREANAAAPVFTGGTAPVTFLTASASNDDLAGVGPFVFQLCPSDSEHGAALAEWAYDVMRAREAAVLYENDRYGRLLREAFVTGFESAGGTITDARPYLAELPSFDPFLRVLRRRGGADVLLLAGSEAAARRLIPTLDSVNLRIRVMGTDRLSGLRHSPAQFAGVLVSSAYLPDRATPRNERFVEEFAAYHDGQLPDHVAAGTFDAVHLLARAIAEVGVDRRAIRDYIASVGGATAPFEGITGSIRFRDNGALADRQPDIGVVTRTGLTRAGS